MAAVDFLLKIEGVDGESKQDGHEKWIDVLNWSWGEHNAASFEVGGGGGAGKVSMQNFVFTQKMHNGSPKLMKQCADGTHFNKAEFRARKAGGGAKCFLTLKFEKVMISSYNTGGTGDDTLPVESVSFGFSKIEMMYKEQLDSGDLGGAMEGGYDLKKGVAI